MVTSTDLFVLSPLGTAADMTLVSDSPFLVDADDEVAFGNIVAWNLQFARRVELLESDEEAV